MGAIVARGPDPIAMTKMVGVSVNANAVGPLAKGAEHSAMIE